MENKDNNKDNCAMCFGGHRHVWHLVVKILILVIVFWLGVKMGELKEMLKEGFYGQNGGRYMMRGGNYQNYPTGPGMMNNVWYGTPQSTTTKR